MRAVDAAGAPRASAHGMFDQVDLKQAAKWTALGAVVPGAATTLMLAGVQEHMNFAPPKNGWPAPPVRRNPLTMGARVAGVGAIAVATPMLLSDLSLPANREVSAYTGAAVAAPVLTAATAGAAFLVRPGVFRKDPHFLGMIAVGAGAIGVAAGALAGLALNGRTAQEAAGGAS